MPADLLDHIMARVDFQDNGCWLWMAALCNGYGSIRTGGKHFLVHRLVYEKAVGPIPEGYEIDHLCRTPACMNPDCLEPVTHAENGLRGQSIMAHNARKTVCCHGHSLDDLNTYTRPDGAGRDCRRCKYERNIKAWLKRKEAARA